MPEIAKRPNGRPPAPQLREDVRRICSLLAAGFSIPEIKAHLGLSQRQFDYRMDLMRRKSADGADVWTKYHGKAETRMRHLEQIRQKAMDDDKLDVARRAIENMIRLDKEIVDVGQSLGQYKKAANKHEVEITAPTLGMFHEPINVTPAPAQLPYEEAELVE